MPELSISKAAEQAPEDLCWVTDGREWSFEEVRLAVVRVVERLGLREMTRKSGDVDHIPVAIEGTRSTLQSVPQLVALLAMFELEVPCVLLHPRWSARETRDVIARCGVQRVLDESTVARAIEGAKGALPREPVENASGDCATQRDHTQQGPAQVVLFTSGTEGAPKGVRLCRSALVSAASASECRLGWEMHDRWLLSLPLAHVGGLSIVTRALCARGTLVLESAPRFDPDTFVSTIQANAVTMVSLVPTMLQRIVRRAVPCPAGLRFALIGGARASVPLLEKAALLGWPCLTTYGFTEAGSQVATQAPELAGCATPGVGRTLEDTELRIATGSGGETDGVGLVEVRGPAMFSGYLGEPVRESGTWFRTGDRGLLDEDGNLYVLGRWDGVLISGGENVVPAQVEVTIEEHCDVQAACVVGVEDDEWGDRLAAVIQRSDGVEHAPLHFELFLRRRLASYKRPKLLRFVDRLPETPAGKLDRAACRALF